MWTIPNILTFLRLLLIPVFIICFYLPWPNFRWVSAGIFLLAAITDWFDGYLARQLNQSSPLGAFLDPVVDKLMVVAALLLLLSEYPQWWMTIATIVIVVREITVSALREWMAEIGQRAAVKVLFIGKVKTTMQMVALLILLSQPVGFTVMTLIGFICLFIAVLMTLWSMCLYLYAARHAFQ